MSPRRVVTLLAAAAAASCGGAQRTVARRCPVERPPLAERDVTRVQARSTQAQSTVTVASEPEDVIEDECVPVAREPRAAGAAPPADAPPANGQPDARAAWWEARIEQHRAALAAAAGDCARVCAAAGGVCEAAREVCRIVGDAHDRCGRARDACADASRRRDGACPACPASR